MVLSSEVSTHSRQFEVRTHCQQHGGHSRVGVHRRVTVGQILLWTRRARHDEQLHLLVLSDRDVGREALSPIRNNCVWFVIWRRALSAWVQTVSRRGEGWSGGDAHSADTEEHGAGLSVERGADHVSAGDGNRSRNGDVRI